MFLPIHHCRPCNSILLAFAFVNLTRAQLNLYSGGLFNDNDISSQCSTAISAELPCDPYLVALTSADSFGAVGDHSLQASMCTTSCGTALSSYHNAVSKACAKDPQPWDGLPAVWAGDALWATYNRTCLKDPDGGGYCSGECATCCTSHSFDPVYVIESLASNITTDTRLANISKSNLCSPCMLALLVQAQSTAYSNYGHDLISQYQEIQSICNVKYPTMVQQSPTNITNYYNYANSSSQQTCLSGNTYKVVPGDSCQGIAAAHGFATGTLQAINNIYPDCTNLIGGSTICLPQTCEVYLVQSGDTCWSIANTQGLTFSLFSGYNPTIDSQCTNLLSGVNVCLSPAAGIYTPTTIAGATVTQTGVYATATITPPSPTPFGTTSRCGKYYEVQSRDYCQQISLNNSISVSLFQEINPSINAGCTNLNPGFYYCVFPTEDWNATGNAASTVTVSAPAPTPSGTTATCFAWHTVVSGDSCAKIEQEYNITFAQLQHWNPSLDARCGNLLLREAYCVSGK